MTSNSSEKLSLPRRLWKGFVREILIPVGTALLVIFFVIQAFRIPSSSMENTLLIGDFLLGLKFVYGSPIPFSDKRLPGLQDPKPGEVVIFRYPGDPVIPDYNAERYTHIANLLMFGNFFWDNQPQEGAPHMVHYPMGPKDFIKRCVAESGQIVEVKAGVLYINNQPHKVPGFGLYRSPVREPGPRDFWGPMKVPSPGDTLHLQGIAPLKLWFYKSLMVQENPQQKVELDIQLFRGKTPVPNFVFPNFQMVLWPHKSFLGNFLYSQMDPTAQLQVDYMDTLHGSMPFAIFHNYARSGYIPQPEGHVEGAMFPASLARSVGYDLFDPTQLEDLESNVATLNSAGDSLHLQYQVVVDGKPIQNYVVKQKAFFMMGDNRDNSADSRYWGFVSHSNVKAKAFIVYFSIDNADNGFAFTNPISWFTLPIKIRWTRLGRLIQDIGRPWE